MNGHAYYEPMCNHCNGFCLKNIQLPRAFFGPKTFWKVTNYDSQVEQYSQSKSSAGLK